MGDVTTPAQAPFLRAAMDRSIPPGDKCAGCPYLNHFAPYMFDCSDERVNGGRFKSEVSGGRKLKACQERGTNGAR